MTTIARPAAGSLAVPVRPTARPAPFRSLLVVSALVSLAFTAAVPLHAAGDQDGTFGFAGLSTVFFDTGGSLADSALDVSLQADGKVLLAGFAEDTATTSTVAVARLLTDGSLDPSFALGGRFTLDLTSGGSEFATKVLQLADGKILVGGYAKGPGTGNDFDWFLLRLLADGTLDTSFGTNGVTRLSFDLGGSNFDALLDLALQPDGKIVAAGLVRTMSTGDDMAFARFLPNGALDTTFGSGGRVIAWFDLGLDLHDNARAVTIQADGKIVAAGYAQVPNGHAIAVVRLTAAGQLDPSFDGDGKRIVEVENVATPNERAFGVVMDDSQRIVIAGQAGQADSQTNAVVRLLADGSLDTSFAVDGSLSIGFGGLTAARDLAITCGGRIVVAGQIFFSATNDRDMTAFRLRPDGALDTSYGSNGLRLVAFDLGQDNQDSAFTLAVDELGRAYVAGSVQRSTAGDLDMGIARLTGDGLCLFADGFESGDTSAWQ